MILSCISTLQAEEQNEKEDNLVFASIQALDHFMRASQAKDNRTAAKWMATYDVHPPKALFESRKIINSSESILSDYQSIDRDVYGYEVKRFMGNVTVLIEGAIRSDFGQAGEYSARLVFNHNRWRILELEIDPI